MADHSTPGPPVGGQALMGGVMMRHGGWWAGAVRLADGRIVTVRRPVPGAGARLRSVPLVRGVLAAVDALVLGIGSTLWSARARDEGRPTEGPSSGGFSQVGLALSVIVAFTFALVVFGLAPTAAAALLVAEGSVGFATVETVIRVALLVAYLALLGRAPDVQRVFAYHGAEHKAVNAYEAGHELTVPVVQAHSRRHGRCGTTFLLVVAVVATVVHLAVGRPSWPVLLGSRLVLLPVVAAAAYELLRLADRHADRRWAAAVRVPGFWLQDLTTREPGDDQVEVAIVALNEAVAAGSASTEAGAAGEGQPAQPTAVRPGAVAAP